MTTGMRAETRRAVPSLAQNTTLSDLDNEHIRTRIDIGRIWSVSASVKARWSVASEHTQVVILDDIPRCITSIANLLGNNLATVDPLLTLEIPVMPIGGGKAPIPVSAHRWTTSAHLQNTLTLQGRLLASPPLPIHLTVHLTSLLTTMSMHQRLTCLILKDRPVRPCPHMTLPTGRGCTHRIRSRNRRRLTMMFQEADRVTTQRSRVSRTTLRRVRQPTIHLANAIVRTCQQRVLAIPATYLRFRKIAKDASPHCRRPCRVFSRNSQDLQPSRASRASLAACSLVSAVA